MAPSGSAKPGFFLPVRVLSTLFRRLMLEQLAAVPAAGKLQCFGEHRRRGAAAAFAACRAPLRTTRWFVYSKRPCAGPQAVRAYLARSTHRGAISKGRLVALDADGVTFRYQDYRRNGQERYRTMTLAPHEFIRRFLSHVLPKGFHRIRHYRLLANGARAATIARAREPAGRRGAISKGRLETDDPAPTDPAPAKARAQPCPCCAGRMIIIATFEAGTMPRTRPSTTCNAISIDPS